MVTPGAASNGTGAAASPPTPIAATSAPIVSPTTATATPAAPAQSTRTVRRAPPRGLVRDAIAEVVVDGGVRVRSRPTVEATSIKYEPLLRRGDAVFITDGPVHADGYDWYLVQSLVGGTDLDMDGPFGWVAAASRDGEVWVEDRAQTRCPKIPDEGQDVVGVLPEEVLLHCFGGAELAIEVEANIHCEGRNAIDPAWLAVDCGVIAGDSCGTCGTAIAAEPSAGIALPREDYARWSIRGHFDDPAAASCQSNATAGVGDPSPDLVVHRCRTTFVLTSLTRLGKAN